jgi:hypothetical protein
VDLWCAFLRCPPSEPALEVERLHHCRVVSHDRTLETQYCLPADVDVETREEDGRVRCRLCLDYCRKDYKGLWVLRKGLYGHDKLACHVKAVQANEAHRQAQAQEGLATPAAATIRPISIHNTDQHKSITPSHEEEVVWEDLGNIDHHDYGQSEADAFDKRCREFEQKVEEYGLWEGDETPFHDDMENIAQAWETAEHEEILEEILQDIGSLSSLMHKQEYCSL